MFGLGLVADRPYTIMIMNLNRKLTFQLCLAALSLSLSSPAHAVATGEGTRGTGDFGVGILLGEPTTITGKYWLSPRSAIDAGVGSTVGGVTILTASYLRHYPNLFGRRSVFVRQLSAYAGLGGILGFEKGGSEKGSLGDRSLSIAAKVPLGVEWVPFDPPVGVFVELSPALVVTPSVSSNFFGGIGIRYYF